MKGAQRATETAQGGEVVSFTVGLPPVALRGNSRSHWGTRKKAADAYSAEVHADFLAQRPHAVYDAPWQRARVTYVWCHAGAAPDISNLGGHTKYLQDILCCAPKLSPQQAQKYKRWHLGIVADDRGIAPVYHLQKMRHRAEERVEITIERVQEAE